MTKQFILGIESSCDETAVAVVANGREVLSNAIASSAEIHKLYGGVVPEIASRLHLEMVLPVLDQALVKAGIRGEDLSAIAVTYGPGLVGSLLTGLSTAKALALAWQKPLVPVHHLAGHIAANYLTRLDLEPPFLALIVSGAHSHIVYVKDYTDFQIIARTRDDAPGEAFDKIARELGLGYPGGPVIDQYADQGNPLAYKLPQTKFDNSLDFSFSGVKTACLNQINRAKMQAGKSGERLPENILADFSASFRQAVVSSLLDHFALAIDQYQVRDMVIAGGVSANKLLRQEAKKLADRLGVRLTIPRLEYCTDNAAMVASQGYFEFLANNFADSSLNAFANLDLASQA